MNKSLFAIAKVTQASGFDGEVRVRPLSRYFDTYIEDKPLFIGISKQLNREMSLKRKIGVGKRIRFRFDGVNTRDEAEALIGQYVYASVNTDDQINWIAEELINAEVETEGGDLVGILTDILWLPCNDVYIIKNGDREFLIPVIPEIVKTVDVRDHLVIIAPMDGLLD